MLTRRTLFAAPLAAALPRIAIGQPARQSLTVAVAKISNTGTLDPLREQSSNASERWMGLLLETPIARDQQRGLERVPGLATAWRRIDGRTLEFDLRPGVVMHDGRTLAAEDVLFSFGPRMFGPEQGLPADIPAVARRHWPGLERVEATGPMTLRLVNGTPDVTMEGRLAAGGSEVVSAASYGGWANFAKHPVGTGPYKLVEFRADNSLTLEAHDPYWGGRPPLGTVRFLEVPEAAARVDGLLSGQYGLASDLSPDQIATVERDKRFTVAGGLVPNHRIVAFDKHHPALRDPRVRLAMAHAIDGQSIVDALWAGRSRVPPGLQWEFYGPMFIEGWTVPPYDPARAKSLLGDAGYKGEPFPYRIRNDYYTAENATAQALAEMWRSVGINAALEVKENWSQVLATTPPRAARDWSNSAVFDDPVSSIVNQHGPHGAQQTNGEWSDDEMNRLSGVLETSTVLETRRAAFARMLQICEREDPAYIVLNQNASFTGKRRELPWKPSPSFFIDLSPRGFGA